MILELLLYLKQNEICQPNSIKYMYIIYMDFKGENKGTSCRKSLTIWWKVWQNVHMDHMDGRACVGPSLLFSD